MSFGQAFSDLLLTHMAPASPLVFLCIGSDRATGDSLGPLLGYKLSQFSAGNFHVYGTLADPVHAKNLVETVAGIYATHQTPYIIAVDASLGSRAHIGYYTLGVGSLKPGTGVGKDLLRVGDAHITGIVNIAGLVDRMLLQTTRLNTVMGLADVISLGIHYGLHLLHQSPKKAERKNSPCLKSNSVLY